MRIVAIRGRDIASLEGPFEVDFERPPLLGAGLFAITGPTGAGKTTLLDVACLALFNKTPRLSAHGGVRIGGAEGADEERLGANDVRQLLRRGAVDALAEIELVAGDGRRYRASWTVKRAHRRTQGRLQEVRRQLVEVGSGRVLAAGGVEVEQAVQRVLGLTFQQFCRSVLLAQGDFAAFLRARPDERADLLEKITGTEIYGALSRAAFDKRKAFDSAAEVERRAAEAIPVLADGERAALEEELAIRAAARAAAGTRVEQVLAAQQAGTRLAEHGALLRQLRAEVEQASAAEAAAAEQLERAVAAEAAVAAAAEEARRRRALLQPELERAAALDRALRDAERGAGDERQRATQARAAAEGAAGLAAALHLEVERRAQVLAELRGWQQVHAGSRRLAEGWEAWQGRLEELVGWARQVEQCRDGLRLAEPEQASLAGQLADAADELQRAEARLRLAVDAAAQAERETAAAPQPAALRARSDQLQAELAALAALEQRALAAAAGSAALAAARQAQREASDQTELAEQRQGAAQAAEQQATAAFERAELELGGAEAALGAAGLRHLLVDGQPCPVCGSEQHPLAAHPVDASARDECRQEVRRRKAEQRHCLRAVAEAADALGAARARRTVAGDALERACSDEAGCRQGWRRFLDGAPPEVAAAWRQAEATAVETLDGLTAARLRTELALAALRQEEERADGQRRSAEQCRQLREQAREAQERAQAAWRAGEMRLQLGERSRAALADRLAQSGEALETVFAALCRGLALDESEQALLRGGPATWRATAEAVVAQWRRNDADAAAAEGEAAELRQRLAVAHAQALREAAQADAAEERAARCQTRCLELLAERRSVLDGRPTDEARRESETRVAAADTAREETSRRLADAQRARTTAETEQRGGSRRLAEETRCGERLAIAWEEARQLARLAGDDEESLTAALAGARESCQRAEASWADAMGRLRGDDHTRTLRAEAHARWGKLEEEAKVWRQLADVIGSADGAKFRKFAQELTLRALLRHTNASLGQLVRRYRLQQVPGAGMELQVVDLDMGDEVRSLHSLSGGETFLVSLALALGLASLATRRSSIGSLFIDEGFGMLDSETLEQALSVLEALQAGGRQVGVVSHMTHLSERIGVRVAVVPRGAGRSVVRVLGPDGLGS